MRAHDPLIAYQFSVDVNGIPGGLISGYFSDVSGISAEYQVIEYKTFNHFLRSPETKKLIGPRVHTPVTLKRGVTADRGFWRWHHMIVMGQLFLARASVSITLHDREYQPLLKWSLSDAWPTKITVPSVSSQSSDILVEELTLVYESLSLNSEFLGISI